MHTHRSVKEKKRKQTVRKKENPKQTVREKRKKNRGGHYASTQTGHRES
jgi:hypothetical protein